MKKEKANLNPTNYLLPDEPYRPTWGSISDEQERIERIRFERYLRIAQLQTQGDILKLLGFFFGGAILFTLVIIILQGFKLWGFVLDTSTINLIGAATIGEVAGLLGIVVKTIFGFGEAKPGESEQPTNKEATKPKGQKAPG